jgi:hypothetical protein
MNCQLTTDALLEMDQITNAFPVNRKTEAGSRKRLGVRVRGVRVRVRVRS